MRLNNRSNRDWNENDCAEESLSALEHVVFTREEGESCTQVLHGESVATLVVRSIAFLRRNGKMDEGCSLLEERNLNAAVEAEDDEVNRAEGWFCM